MGIHHKLRRGWQDTFDTAAYMFIQMTNRMKMVFFTVTCSQFSASFLQYFKHHLQYFSNVDMLLEAPCNPFLFTIVSAKQIEKTFSVVKLCFCHKFTLFHTFYESQEAQEAQEANQCLQV